MTDIANAASRRVRIARWLQAAIFVGLGLPFAAQAALTVTPITWDVVGLDSNRPLTAGPELFPVGARICTDADATNVIGSLVWDDSVRLISTRVSVRFRR